MEEECQYSQFILGKANVVDKLPKELLFEVKKNHPHVQVWCECFIRSLIAKQMKVEDFIDAYKRFSDGDRTIIWELDILPANLRRNRRLAIKYMDALMYTTFKRDLTKILTTVPILERIGDPYFN